MSKETSMEHVFIITLGAVAAVACISLSQCERFDKEASANIQIECIKAGRQWVNTWNGATCALKEEKK